VLSWGEIRTIGLTKRSVRIANYSRIIALAFVWLALQGIFIWLLNTEIQRLFLAWQTADWFEFDSFALSALPGVLVYSRFISYLISAERNHRAELRAHAAVAGAVAADDRVAPILPPLAGTSHLESHAWPLIIAPICLTSQAKATAAAIICVFGGILCFISGLTALVLQSVEGAALPSSIYGAIWGVTLMSLFICILSGEAWYKLSRPINVQIDEWGIAWQERGIHERTRRFSWHEAQTFVVASTVPSATWPISGLLIRQVYALVASAATFSWQIKNPTTAELRASQTLIEAISVKTRLPLRDVSTALTSQFWNLSLKRDVSSHTPSTITPLSTYVPERRGQRIRAWLLGIVIGSLLLQSAIPFFFWPAANWLREQQVDYYTQLARQARLQPTIFADHLSASDGYWPETADDDTSGWRYFFANGEYHLTGTDPKSLMYAWGADPLNDAAVEVNATQYWRSKDANDGVGLLLRRDVGDFNRVVFQVSPDGEWSLWRYHYETRTSRDWHIMDEGTSSAIRLGTGVPNRLLVIMKGHLFLCFINDQFVASVYDEHASIRGRMGVYMNTSDTEGVFSDFAVYPAPDITWPWQAPPAAGAFSAA
jgi:hypothetical protein